MDKKSYLEVESEKDVDIDEVKMKLREDAFNNLIDQSLFDRPFRTVFRKK